MKVQLVIPAQAGIQHARDARKKNWTPAFAGVSWMAGTSPAMTTGNILDKSVTAVAVWHPMGHDAGMPPRQPDLFDTEEQADLFGEDAPTPEYRADPEQVRAELHMILAEARAGRTLPWEPRKATLYRTIFPQMTLWLPEEEAAQLRFEFETELQRLKAA